MKEMMSFISNFIRNAEGALNIYGKIGASLLVLFAVVISGKILTCVIDQVTRRKERFLGDQKRKRLDTLMKTVGKIIVIFMYFVALISVLNIMGVNTASILATAGIGSVAIGFGAQSLVRDAISGLFILLEDQYAVGEFVKIADKRGIVEDLSIRLTKIRDLNGDLHMIPNGTIQTVTNMSRGDVTSLIKIGIAYEEDVERAVQVMQSALDELAMEMKEVIHRGPIVQGISRFAESGIEIQILVGSAALDQWEVSRAINMRLKKTLKKHDIEIPYAKLELVHPSEEKK